MTDRNELERLLAAEDAAETLEESIISASNLATWAIHNGLSLMDEVERLRAENEAGGRNVAQLQRDGVKFCEALRKCADLVRRYNGRQAEKLDDIPAIVAQALGETHDN